MKDKRSVVSAIWIFGLLKETGTLDKLKIKSKGCLKALLHRA